MVEQVLAYLGQEYGISRADLVSAELALVPAAPPRDMGFDRGGTIGGEFSSQNIEVIDFGVPLLSIHTPFAVSSKVDIYNLYKAARAFYQFTE